MLLQQVLLLFGWVLLVATDIVYLVTPRSLKHYCLRPKFFEVPTSISTSVEWGIGEGGVVLETATLAGLMSSRFVYLGSPLSAVPGKVVMHRMPIAGVATAGINVAAAAGE